MSSNYDKNTKYLSIEKAKYIDEYKIFLSFDDGKQNVLDFGDFITKSQHPDVRKYQDKKLFRSFDIKHGELMWDDFDMVFPVSDLYHGKL